MSTLRLMCHTESADGPDKDGIDSFPRRLRSDNGGDLAMQLLAASEEIQRIITQPTLSALSQ